MAEACLALPGRVGFRCVVSSGGEASRDAADLVAFLAEDEETAAVGLFLETVRRPDAFMDALSRCADAGKPVVCLKVGRSEAGARVALAHTGALVGSDRAFSAVLAAYGVIEVHDFNDLVETLEALGRKRRPRGMRIGAVSESGGEAALFADHAEAAGLPFAPLPEPLVDALRAEFPNYLAPGNPLDAWAVDDPERVYPRSLELMAGVGCIRHPRRAGRRFALPGRYGPGLVRPRGRRARGRCRGDGDLPGCRDRPHGRRAARLQLLATERDLPILRGLAAAARALAAAARWQPARPPALAEPPVDLGDLLDGDGALPELESAQIAGALRRAVRRRPSGRRHRRRRPRDRRARHARRRQGRRRRPQGGAGGVVLGVQTPEEAAGPHASSADACSSRGRSRPGRRRSAA